jgi:glycosyltransferase involved in cell wall biosynthesis
MIDSKARVTIGLPVYNGERFLKETLDAILSQTYANFEVIISDNASTDGTPKICKEYAAKDSRIHYFRKQENIGAIKNFNHVFELSTSEYFKWAAADDLIAPQFLEKCLEVLDKDSGVILCYPNTTIIDEKGTFLGHYDVGANLISESPSGRFLQLMYNVGMCNPIMGLIRSGFLRKTSLFRAIPSCDKILLAELCFLGRFKEIPDYLFFRRFHAETSSSYARAGDIEKRRHWLNPGMSKVPILMPSWKQFTAYLISIKRAPIKRTAKAHLTAFMVMRVMLNYKQYLNELRATTRELF